MGVLSMFSSDPDVQLQEEANAAKLLAVQTALKEKKWYSEIEGLKSKIKGKVISPTDDEKAYMKERTKVWNGDAAGFPYIMVQPSAENVVSDVQTVLAFVKANNVDMCIAGGYHSVACMISDTIMLDMCLNKTVEIDAGAKTVKVGSGCKLGDIDPKLAKHNLACVWGTNPDTGIAGLALVGGIGYLTPKYGFTCDNFLSIDMVLPSGQAITVTEDNEYADLMVGLRGAGIFYGVITSFTMKCHSIGKVFGGLVVAQIPEMDTAVSVLAKVLHKLDTSSPELSGAVSLPLGTDVITQIYTFFGMADKIEDVPELEEAISIGGGFNVKNEVKRCSYHDDVQHITDPFTGKGDKYMGAFALREINEEVARNLLELTHKSSSSIMKECRGVLILQPVKGKARDVVEHNKSCVPHRFCPVWVVVDSTWTGFDKGGLKRAACKQWVQTCKEKLAPWIYETAHAVETDTKNADVYTKNHKKIVADLKAKYNPDGVIMGNAKAKVDDRRI
eukprot:CFRG7461T1